jgi:DAPG hydrolase PhiG domain
MTMRTKIPEALRVPWELRPNLTAKTGTDRLAGGRRRYWVDEVLQGVTPEMLAWWFAHLDGDMDLEGRRVPRYRVWHPLDHVYATYVRRAADGSAGPGAQVANLEYLGRNPRYRVEVVATIERLDSEMFVHTVDAGGMYLARMEHVFERVAGGTRFGHFLIVPGRPMPRLGKIVVPLFWPEEKGQAWLKHATEEMGNLPNFLPGLYEREAAAGPVLPGAATSRAPAFTASQAEA